MTAGNGSRHPVPLDRKGVVMLSGGLDSTLAARILLGQGIALTGLYLSAPWGCCDKTQAMKAARLLGIEFLTVKLTQEYIGVIRDPKYGYGSSMNPCIDCRIYMFEKARALLPRVGASFLVTGEVLGQRPMSQMRNNLTLIEERAGMKGRIVRPLSAKVLPPSIPEQAGVIDRGRLYGITGRSRKEQMALAEAFGIVDYPNPAGGCMLTDRQFGRRVKDLFDHQTEIGLEDMELLRLGRQFRAGPEAKWIIGRNEAENKTLREYLAPGRCLLEPQEFPGPSALLIGPPNDDLIRLGVGLITRYTRPDKLPPGSRVTFRVGASRDGSALPSAGGSNGNGIAESRPLEASPPEEALERMRIG